MMCWHVIPEVLENTKASIEFLWQVIDRDPDFKFPDYHGEKMTLQDCWVAFEKRYVLIGELIDIFILVKLLSAASSFQPCTRHKT